MAEILPRLTIDTNTLIDLDPETDRIATTENRTASARELVQQHRAGAIRLCVPAIIASERQPGKRYLTDFADFQARLARCDLEDAEVLLSIGNYNMVYWGWFIWGDEATVELERRIHDILFPRLEFDYSAFATERGLSVEGGDIDKTWRNARCDVLAMWAHISAKADAFVTSDANFHVGTKAEALAGLGARQILYPREALRFAGPSNA